MLKPASLEGGDSLLGLDLAATSSAAVRGTKSRENLLQKRKTHPGHFSRAIMAQMLELYGGHRLGRPPSAQTYLELSGGDQHQVMLGLIAWTVARALDEAAAGEALASADTLSLLLLFPEQTAFDNGSCEIASLLLFARDPPSSLWSNRHSAQARVLGLRPFTPLAKEEWTTTLLAYMREAQTIKARHAELGHPGAGVPAGGGGGSASSTGAPPAPLPKSGQKPPDPNSKRQ